jgi:hypothetical protein
VILLNRKITIKVFLSLIALLIFSFGFVGAQVEKYNNYYESIKYNCNNSENSGVKTSNYIKGLSDSSSAVLPLEEPSTSFSHANNRTAYALCVGVANYPGTDNDLEYCDDDATEMRSWFVNEFNVPLANTQVLTDSSAYTSTITSQISNFASLMDENDYFYFSFSGHGSGGLVEGEELSWHVESPHPYSNYYDHYWHYSYPGAELMRVHFTRIETEYGYDGVFVGDYHETEYAYDLFTGDFYDEWSNWVISDDIYVELYTDYSNTDWGFEVDKVQIGYWGEPYEIIPYDGLYNGISGIELDALFDEIPGTVIATFDSCFSGSVGNQVAGNNRYIVSGGTDNELTLEDSGHYNGLFTYQFLQAWNTATDQNSDTVLSFEEVFPDIYSGTVSRSTYLGYVHHPDEFDGVSDELILTTNAEILDASYDGSGNLDLSIALNGLGFGAFGVYYYDVVNQTYYSPYSGLMEPTGSIQEYEISAPPDFNTDLITVRIEANYEGIHEEDEEIFNPGAIVFNVTDDADSDGLDDLYEYDNGLNPWSNDTDSDTLYDDWEILNGLDPSNPDTDLDGLNDGDEINTHGTDPLDPDTDGDTMYDGYEVYYGLNATDSSDKNGDPDSDSLLNFMEFIYNTSPISDDTDSDTMGDLYEVNWGLDPTVNDANSDLDDDNLTNIEEYNLTTEPNNPDTDMDGLLDGDEVHTYGSNPLYEDTDADGLLDGTEVNDYGSDPLLRDTDSDSLGDFEEVMIYGTNPCDRDTDHDGIWDSWELSLGTNPCSGANSPLLYLGFLAIAMTGFIAIPVSGSIAKKKASKKREPSKLGVRPPPSKVEKVEPIYRPQYQSPYSQGTQPTNQDVKRIVNMLLSGICPACGGRIDKNTLSCTICRRNYIEFYKRIFGGGK